LCGLQCSKTETSSGFSEYSTSIPVGLHFGGNQPMLNPGKEETVMDVNKILVELRQEREQIEDAIVSLERLARGRGKRRGRPP